MEVIQRSISGKTYFYLKHSYRKGGKVVTKEKYLGKTRPKDLELIRKKFLKEIKSDLYLKFSTIKNGFKKKWNTLPHSIKRKQLIRFSVYFTYNSNAIEGSTLTEIETEELIQQGISPNKPIEDVLETVNHSKTFLGMLNEKKDLSGMLIKTWHKNIFFQTKPDISGRYRDFHVRVGAEVCPDWQDIEQLMKDFFSWYNKNKTLEHPIELAAVAHYKFIKIHPFGDGNGRIVRLIVNFILHKYHYPLIAIEKKKRQSYYRAIRGGEKKFVQYFARRYLSFHKKYDR